MIKLKVWMWRVCMRLFVCRRKHPRTRTLWDVLQSEALCLCLADGLRVTKYGRSLSNVIWLSDTLAPYAVAETGWKKSKNLLCSEKGLETSLNILIQSISDCSVDFYTFFGHWHCFCFSSSQCLLFAMKLKLICGRGFARPQGQTNL